MLLTLMKKKDPVHPGVTVFIVFLTSHLFLNCVSIPKTL